MGLGEWSPETRKAPEGAFLFVKVLVNHRKFYRVFFDNTSEILNSYVLLQRAQVTSSTFRVTKLCAFLDAPHGMISNSQTTRCFFVVILGSLPFCSLFYFVFVSESRVFRAFYFSFALLSLNPSDELNMPELNPKYKKKERPMFFYRRPSKIRSRQISWISIIQRAWNSRGSTL